jgi:hypothetical protein
MCYERRFSRGRVEDMCMCSSEDMCKHMSSILPLEKLSASTCPPLCVFVTAVPNTKVFVRGGGGMEDMCYERLRAEAGVD